MTLVLKFELLPSCGILCLSELTSRRLAGRASKRGLVVIVLPDAGLSSPSPPLGVFLLGVPTGLRPSAAHLYRWLGIEDTALHTPRSSRPGLLARDQGKSWLQGWQDKGHGELNRYLLGLLGLPHVRVSGQSVVLATTPWGSYGFLILDAYDCNIVTVTNPQHELFLTRL